MRDYSDTETELNLMNAFCFESIARNKYSYFASRARKDGYEQIAAIFEHTADNEKEHAKLWYKELFNIEDTLDNLLEAASGENNEWSHLYSSYAKTALEEGFPELAHKFELIGEIEKQHEKRYRLLMQNIASDNVFSKPEVTVWECRNCGHLHIGTTAPDTCPVCDHPGAFFELRAENY